jgi:hypothetical protein
VNHVESTATIKSITRDVSERFWERYFLEARAAKKANSPRLSSELGNAISVRLEQSEKAYFPMLVSEAGKVTSLRDSHVSKACSPTLVSETGRSIRVRYEELKAYSPMLVNEAGRVIPVKPEPLKTRFPILVTGRPSKVSGTKTVRLETTGPLKRGDLLFFPDIEFVAFILPVIDDPPGRVGIEEVFP